MSEIGDILEQATKVLDEKGWCQHELANHQGAVCLYGAINTVLWGDAMNMSISDRKAYMVEAAGEALYDHLPESYKGLVEQPCGKRGCVVDFNNDPRTTVADVKDLVAKTIANEGVTIA